MIQFDEHIFQIGWNHQPETVLLKWNTRKLFNEFPPKKPHRQGYKISVETGAGLKSGIPDGAYEAEKNHRTGPKSGGWDI